MLSLMFRMVVIHSLHGPLDDYEAFVAELNCLREAKLDVIAEYALAGFEFVDEFEDVLLERV